MKIYSGVEGLYRRPSFAFAITAGMKVTALREEQRPYKRCRCNGRQCRACRGSGWVRMGGGVWLNLRLFVKKFRSLRKVGQPAHEGVRPLAPEFADVNGVTNPDPEILGQYRIDHRNPPPTGSNSITAFLASSHPNGRVENGREVSPPGWNQHLRAQKLGRGSGYGFRRDPSLEDGKTGVDRDRNPAPGGAPECTGDGRRATRWMCGSRGWDWYEITCPSKDCVFSGPDGACKVSSTLNLITPHGWAQYQSKGADTGAGLLGLFGTRDDPGTLTMEAAELGIPSLYMLPLRLEISARTKGAGAVRWGKGFRQMGARRFPVVDVTVAQSLVEFRHHQLNMLAGQQPRIALPPAPDPEALIEADHDLLVAGVDPGERPGVESSPGRPAPSAVLDAEGDLVSARRFIKENYVAAGIHEGDIGKALVAAGLKERGMALPDGTPLEAVRTALRHLLGDRLQQNSGRRALEQVIDQNTDWGSARDDPGPPKPREIDPASSGDPPSPSRGSEGPPVDAEVGAEPEVLKKTMARIRALHREMNEARNEAGLDLPTIADIISDTVKRRAYLVGLSQPELAAVELAIAELMEEAR